jgi:dihydrofolate synthase/folylpolyglutamate synthase
MLFIIFQTNNPRGLNATILAHKARENITGAVFNSTTAYQNALEAAKDADLIYIMESTFVVEIL